MDDSIQRLSGIEESGVLILHFINPFHEKHSESKTHFERAHKTQEKILRLFKTTANEEFSQDNFNLEGNSLDSSFYYPSVPDTIRAQVSWLSRKLSKAEKASLKVSVFEFNRISISCVLHFISLIGLKYSIMKSRCEEELFVKVFASEHWLRKRACEMNYRLKFAKKSKSGYDFKQVPPYGPIWLMNRDRRGEDLFVHYDCDSREVNRRESLFTFIDKYRIVTKYLSGFLDIRVLKNYDVLFNVFTIHEEVPISKLIQEWANFSAVLKPQPINDIKTYFSEQIAFYFAWLNTYKNIMKTCALIGAVVSSIQLLAFIQGWHPQVHILLQILFNLFLSIWGVFFEKYWSRREKELSWEWGTLHFVEQEIQREQFKGKFKKDEATGTMKIFKIKNIKDSSLKIISISAVIIVISLVIIAVISVFQLRVSMMTDNNMKKFGGIISGLVYVIQIKIFDFIYSKLAQVLNNWENHETINQHNNSLAFKLFLFQFVNNYSGLFYISFFKEHFEGCSENGCMFDLGLQLVIIFVVNLALNAVELGIPWIFFRFRKMIEKRKHLPETVLKELHPIEIQSQLEPYDQAIEDYLEMCIQFGFVALFGASCPIVAALALFEIVWEIRIDAWKLCYLVRRPDPVKTEEIGIWKSIVVSIAYIGVFTNSGIIIFTSGLLNNTSFKEKCMIFLVLEHALMLIIWVLKHIIPSYPPIVKKGQLWSKRIVQKKISQNSYASLSIFTNTLPTSFEFNLESKLINY